MDELAQEQAKSKAYTPSQRPSLRFYLLCPIWTAAVFSVPFLNNYIHAFDGAPEAVTVEQLAQGYKPRSRHLIIEGFVDARRHVTVVTRSSRRRTSEGYTPLVSVADQATRAPVPVLVQFEQISPELRDEMYRGRRPVQGVVRSVLWEGLSDSHRGVIERAGVRLAPNVLLLSTATPWSLLQNALIYGGILLALLYAMMIYSYIYNLRAWRRGQQAGKETVAGQPAPAAI